MFPKRYITAVCPEYPDLKFQLLANPTGALYDELRLGYAGDDESRQKLGAAFVEAFAGGVVEGYGVKLDFSTAESAVGVLLDDNLPIDLRAWVRNAPIDIVEWGREQTRKNLGNSFGHGNS